MVKTETLLALEGVSAGYGGRPVLRDVSCVVEAGACVGILGPNGAGKTTLLRVMAGSLWPSRGTVRLLDRPLGEWEPRARAQRLAVVHQEHETVIPVRVKEAVLAGRSPYLSWLGWESKQDAGVVASVMEDFQLTPLEDRWLHTLSSGERQRVWLAMAAAQRPRILLLDEPTAHLDLAVQMEAMGRARAACAAGGAVVWVSHDLNLAARYCTSLLVLAGGALVAEGRPEAVVTPEIVSRVYGPGMSVERARDGHPMVVPRVTNRKS